MIVENPTNDDTRGQVGIGTLIIFIAMVLVAAVAAGVLINTAGLLESTASDTGQDAQSQVSNQVTVVSAVGQVDGSAGNISTLDFTVMKSAGSGDIDLANATVEYTAGQVSRTLTFDNGSASARTSYEVYEINDSDFNNPLTTDSAASVVLDDSGDRRVLRVSLTALKTSKAAHLDEGGEATVRVVTQSGAATIYGVNVPDTISDETTVPV